MYHFKHYLTHIICRVYNPIHKTPLEPSKFYKLKWKILEIISSDKFLIIEPNF